MPQDVAPIDTVVFDSLGLGKLWQHRCDLGPAKVDLLGSVRLPSILIDHLIAGVEDLPDLAHFDPGSFTTRERDVAHRIGEDLGWNNRIHDEICCLLCEFLGHTTNEHICFAAVRPSTSYDLACFRVIQRN